MTELKETIAVFGLGYIGLPFCAALANVGYKVVGMDVDVKRVENLKNGLMPFYEPGLKEGLDSHKERIEYVNDSAIAMQKADAVFLTVGTPVSDDGTPDFSQIDSCIESIGPHLQKGQIIVLKSTVVIGTTEERVIPRLEALSTMKAGKDFFIAFCPERTIEGLALHEIYNLPKIIGGITLESSNKAASILRRLGGKTTIVSSPKVAEICKLIDNIYRATNIAFANELGMLCEMMSIDAKEVTSAVNYSYPRTSIFSPGLGADGPCLSKDPLIFKHSAMQQGVATPVIDGCVLQNTRATLRVADIVSAYVSKHNLSEVNLAIVGLAFKGFPETDDIRGSPALKILDELNRKKIVLASSKAYDPLVKSFDKATIAKNLETTLEGANVILFLTNHPRIMNIDFSRILPQIQKKSLIVDAWGNVNLDVPLPESISYHLIGNGRLITN